MTRKHDRELSPKEVAALGDEDIDTSDIPELDEAFWEKAQVRYPVEKKAISIRMDADVLEWFKAGGKGYQSRINAVLRAYKEARE